MAGVLFPTSEQIEALQILKDQGDQQILIWLAFARSIEPDFKFCVGSASLSPSVINAVRALRECGDGRLVMWLDMARSSGIPILSS